MQQSMQFFLHRCLYERSTDSVQLCSSCECSSAMGSANLDRPLLDFSKSLKGGQDSCFNLSHMRGLLSFDCCMVHWSVMSPMGLYHWSLRLWRWPLLPALLSALSPANGIELNFRINLWMRNASSARSAACSRSRRRRRSSPSTITVDPPGKTRAILLYLQHLDDPTTTQLLEQTRCHF